jgi:hypothetical protein
MTSVSVYIGEGGICRRKFNLQQIMFSVAWIPSFYIIHVLRVTRNLHEAHWCSENGPFSYLVSATEKAS